MTSLEDMRRELRRRYEKLRESDEEVVRERIRKCDMIEEFDERLSCKSELLHEITEMQDVVNLDVMADFRKTDPKCSEDSRWIPVHIIDNANAVILGISKAEYKPEVFWHRGSYVHDKFEKLCSRLRFGLPSVDR